jgi:hypothetical protein
MVAIFCDFFLFWDVGRDFVYSKVSATKYDRAASCPMWATIYYFDLARIVKFLRVDQVADLLKEVTR